jgi:hypothetical protein
MVEGLALADTGARAAIVLGLQGRVANSGLSRVLARQGDHADGGGGPPAATGDEIQDALQELRDSGDLIDRNTAERVDSGALKVMYLDDLRTDPDNDALLEGWGYDKTQFVVRLSPAGAQMVVQTNAQGTLYTEEDGTIWLFVAKGVGVPRMRTILVHETNHAMRLHDGSDAADSFERYQDEFQAYWVSEFREVEDLDDRAAQIRAHLLRDYPAIKARYETDEDFKAQVDAYTRPDANVLNSERWRRIEEAAAGLGTDEAAIFAAIRAMSPEEREAAKGDPNFMALLRDELSGEDLARALMLLDGATELTAQALDAMSGLGTDEDALFAALQAMGTDEKLLLRRNADFMARLHDDLSGDELQRALELLEVPMGDFPVMAGEDQMA